MSILNVSRTASKTTAPANGISAKVTGDGAIQAATAPTATRSSGSTGYPAKALAVTRVVIGFVFLWAFLDKTFGWHYATVGQKAWINGGSPTKGFLGSVDVGPFQSTFHNMAGTAWADWLFMLGLAGIGLAMILGVALRVTAVAGTVMMLLMWAAEWPLAQHTASGAATMSPNPIVDYHIIYAVAIIALALAQAGTTWGLANVWAKLPIVKNAPWLR